jgi:hypothetical protein
MAYLSTAAAQGAVDNVDVIENETDEMANWLDNNLETSTDISFYRWDFGEIPINDGEYGEGQSGQNNFANDALQHIGENRAVVDGENILIGHEIASWGYGGDGYTYTNSDGKKIWGSVVYIGQYVQDWTKRVFTWHELAHNYGAKHEHGDYSTNSNNKITAITPMLVSYIRDPYGNCNTECYYGVNFTACGSGFVPSNVDTCSSNKPNDPTDGDYVDCGVNTTYHHDHLNYCAEEAMEDEIDSNSHFD